VAVIANCWVAFTFKLTVLGEAFMDDKVAAQLTDVTTNREASPVIASIFSILLMISLLLFATYYCFLTEL
jgi:hypothetical protein